MLYRYGYYDRFIAKQLNIFLFEYLHIKSGCQEKQLQTQNTLLKTRLQNARAIQMSIRNFLL